MTVTTMTLSNGTVTVTFGALNPAFTHRYNNPMIAEVNTPITASQKIGANTVIINLGMIQDTIGIDFTVTDGYGTFDFQTPGSTVYEKLVYLMHYEIDPKVLTLGSETFYCQVSGFSMSFGAGMKDVGTGSIQLTLCDNIAMS